MAEIVQPDLADSGPHARRIKDATAEVAGVNRPDVRSEFIGHRRIKDGRDRAVAEIPDASLTFQRRFTRRLVPTRSARR